MQKGSNKKLKIILAAVIGVLILFGGILAVTIIGTANGWFSTKSINTSGTFIGSTHNFHDSGFTYSAKRANGYARINADLSKEDLDSLTISSSMGNGEMSVILSSGDVSRTVELNNGSMKLSAADIDTSAFTPGRIRIELRFNNAENIEVDIKWR